MKKINKINEIEFKYNKKKKLIKKKTKNITYLLDFIIFNIKKKF